MEEVIPHGVDVPHPGHRSMEHSGEVEGIEYVSKAEDALLNQGFSHQACRADIIQSGLGAFPQDAISVSHTYVVADRAEAFIDHPSFGDLPKIGQLRWVAQTEKPRRPI